MKAVIIQTLSSRYAPPRQGDFIWVEKYQKHIWQGRELSLGEFNHVIDSIIADEDLSPRPTIRMVEDEVIPQEEPPAPPAEAKPVKAKAAQAPGKRKYQRKVRIADLPPLPPELHPA